MCCEQSTGLPKGREPYGDGASIVVSGRESRLHGHRGSKEAQRRSETGFPWKGRQGTRDANSRNDPQHYPRPRQAETPRREKPLWMKIMISRKRKSIPLCRRCHDDIHSNRLTSKKQG